MIRQQYGDPFCWGWANLSPPAVADYSEATMETWIAQLSPLAVGALLVTLLVLLMAYAHEEGWMQIRSEDYDDAPHQHPVLRGRARLVSG